MHLSPRSILLSLCVLLLTGDAVVAEVSADNRSVDRPSHVVRDVLEMALRYPDASPVDVHKSLHQATLGSAHRAPVREQAVRHYFSLEWDKLDGVASYSPMVESLGPDWVRVNMAEWRAQGGSAEPLIDAFLRGLRVRPDSALFHQSRHALLDALRCSSAMDRPPSRVVLADSLEALWDRLKDEGWPAVHHSENYRRQYNPHYRVIPRSALPELTVSKQPGTIERRR